MKTTISVTVDPIVLQKFDALIENRSKEIEAMMKKRAEEEQKDFEVEIANEICCKVGCEEGIQRKEIEMKYKGFDFMFDVKVQFQFENGETICAVTIIEPAVFKNGEEISLNVLPNYDEVEIGNLVKEFI